MDPIVPNPNPDPLLNHLRSCAPTSFVGIGTRDSALTSQLSSAGDSDISVSTSENGRLVYQIPYKFAQNFDQIFKKIDENPQNFNIQDYQVRVSSLEEVFIETGKQSALKSDKLK